jgi:transposase-like protein
MSKILRKPGCKSRYPEAFKKQVATVVLKEGLSWREASVRFGGIPFQTISRWANLYYDEIEQTNIISSMENQIATVPDTIQKELEAKLNQAQLKITALEAMIDIAETTYRISIRKNSGTKQPQL